ncbi:response regulator [Jannaschia sp. Os4]|uniref:hybrid sensor histidine kinase/response regulator n=1 Tax=Jannaschia sp. Os4 TaxID=2807617 RepID=UPI00193A67AD|nr:ATP-binding protein [Jannaschia sp. Os4]MBM2576641.1 response regulator [Jannaschia sp. Os4]
MPTRSDAAPLAGGAKPSAPRLPSGPAAWTGALLAAGCLAAAGGTLGPPEVTRGAWMTAAALAAAGLLPTLVAWALRRRAAARLERLLSYLAHDAHPALVSDADGTVSGANPAARERLGARRGGALADALGQAVEDPHGVAHRLRVCLDAGLEAREDVETRRGNLRVTATRVPDGTLWRIDRLEPRAASGGGGALPSMTVSDGGTILWMNATLRDMLGRRPKRLSEVVPGPAPTRSGAVHEVRLGDRTEGMRLILSPDSDGRRQVFLLPADEAGSEEGEVLDALPIAVLRLDARGHVTGSNRMAKLLLPRVRESGATLSGMVEGLGRPVRAWVEEAAAGRSEHKAETVRVTDSVPDLYLQITLARALGHDGAEAGLVAVLSDATELKTMEAQFVQSQKMQAIGQLAGGVAHDFNNLLTAISGNCDLLLMRHGADDPSHDDLMEIHRNAGRAAALVGQLLAFSRKQTLELTDVDLEDTLADLTHLLDRLVGDNVRLTLAHGEGLRPIRGDRRQLEQVVVNLVVNARDAMPGGGDVRIETALHRLDAPLARDRATVPQGDYVVISVADEGSGIPPDRLSRIFEPFFTTKRPGEGTGLGLSMAYGIVKQSGGYIFADSEVGQGTVFRIFLPALASGADPVPVPPEEDGTRTVPPTPMPTARRAAEEGPVVLLVEDEAPVRAFASRALRMQGYAVVEAPDAEAALAHLADGAAKVDLIVTDVMMPGMDGPTWVRRALRDRPDMRTVFVSGYSQDALSDDAAPVPNSTFLPKPFSLAELTATVARVLEG